MLLGITSFRHLHRFRREITLEIKYFVDNLSVMSRLMNFDI